MARAQKPFAVKRPAPSRSGAALPSVPSSDLPQSIEAEISVLGSMILGNETIDVVIPLLSTSDFASASHRKIYEAIPLITAVCHLRCFSVSPKNVLALRRRH